ncbi:unnamed protein product, partial [Prorocentrum cordatum]
ALFWGSAPSEFEFGHIAPRPPRRPCAESQRPRPTAAPLGAPPLRRRDTEKARCRFYTTVCDSSKENGTVAIPAVASEGARNCKTGPCETARQGWERRTSQSARGELVRGRACCTCAPREAT